MMAHTMNISSPHHEKRHCMRVAAGSGCMKLDLFVVLLLKVSSWAQSLECRGFRFNVSGFNGDPKMRNGILSAAQSMLIFDLHRFSLAQSCCNLY